MALTDNLISFWSLEEASGTRADDVIATGNDLTDTNTVTNAVGKVGNAADFELSNGELLSRTSNASLQTGNIDFTWCSWVQLESKPATSMEIISKDTQTGGPRDYDLDWITGTDRFRFIVFDAPTGIVPTIVTANSFGAPSLATFYFIVGWHDATADTISIQINNGTIDSTAHANGTRVSNAIFTIGCRGIAVPSLFWDGLIDQVGFWKRVLTADERTFLYNNNNGRSYAEIQTGLPTGTGWGRHRSSSVYVPNSFLGDF